MIDLALTDSSTSRTGFNNARARSNPKEHRTSASRAGSGGFALSGMRSTHQQSRGPRSDFPWADTAPVAGRSER